MRPHFHWRSHKTRERIGAPSTGDRFILFYFFRFRFFFFFQKRFLFQCGYSFRFWRWCWANRFQGKLGQRRWLFIHCWRGLNGRCEISHFCRANQHFWNIIDIKVQHLTAAYSFLLYCCIFEHIPLPKRIFVIETDFIHLLSRTLPSLFWLQILNYKLSYLRDYVYI